MYVLSNRPGSVSHILNYSKSSFRRDSTTHITLCRANMFSDRSHLVDEAQNYMCRTCHSLQRSKRLNARNK